MNAEKFQKRPHRRPLQPGSHRYFMRGASERPAPGVMVIEEQKQAKLKPYDHMLRKFLHRDALDAAIATEDPTIAAAVIEELGQRSMGLQSAIGM